MQVILLQNIKGVGRIGDIKNVSDGYARNFLLPRGLAKGVTEGTMKDVETLKKKVDATAKIEQEKLVQAAEKLKDMTIQFSRKAGKTGKLYAGVTAQEIAGELTKKSGFRIDLDMVDLKEHEGHIKRIGEYIVPINLGSELKVEVKIIVTIA